MSPRLARRAVVAALLALPAAASAQNWPTQPIKFIVSQSAGGSIDIAARLIGQKLSVALGQQVVIDNRAGANGMIAGEAAARAPADGSTFLMTSPSTLTINQHVYKKVPYDALRDFAPVTQTTSIVFALVVNAASPYRTVADLVAAARAKPDAIRYASAGVGNQSHLAAEVFAAAAGVQMLHVAYKGEAPAITDLLGGQVDMIFGTAPALLGQVRAGKMRALAVGQPRRAAAAPDVPSIAEAGYPQVLVTGWTGIVAPAATPAPIIRRLHDEVVKVLAMPDVRETLAKAGAEPVGSTPEQFGEFIRSETQKWGAAVKRAGIVPE
ncbi:MAG: tripartite tricarboxylate transporter substrate binding protein [Burkholderiales bacterium]|nr:tripartite tricarboxylate transporter substrate binding protein [Burkholderiales bacterium]